LIAETEKVIKSIQNDGPDEDVMQKIKEAQRQTRMKSIRENNYWLSMMEMVISDGLDFSELTLETLEKRLNSMSAQDIREAAKKYIDDQNRIQVVMHPANYKAKK
jgi:zinc protease